MLQGKMAQLQTRYGKARTYYMRSRTLDRWGEVAFLCILLYV